MLPLCIMMQISVKHLHYVGHLFKSICKIFTLCSSPEDIYLRGKSSEYYTSSQRIKYHFIKEKPLFLYFPFVFKMPLSM